MLFSEFQLTTFQQCPGSYARLSKHPDNDYQEACRGYGISDPVQQVTKWLWAQELRTGLKQTFRATKHKWGQLVTSWGIEGGLSNRKTRDYLTKHMAALTSYYDFYLNSGCVPLVVGNPIRLKAGEHTLDTLPQVIVVHNDIPMVLNTSCDTNNWETENNLVYASRLLAVHERLGNDVVLYNHRFSGRLESNSFNTRHLSGQQASRTLEQTLNLMASGYDIHWLGCNGKCGGGNA